MLINNENIENHQFFLKSISIYIRRPQLVNKTKISHASNEIFVKLIDIADLQEIKKELKKLQTCELDEVKRILAANIKNDDRIDIKEIESLLTGKYFIINRLEPRDSKKFKSRFIGILFDIKNDLKIVDFFVINDPCSDNLCPSSDYQFSCSEKSLSLSFDENDQSSNFLRFVLFVKISNWMKIGENDSSNPLKLESHSLINSDSFSELYSRLKEKYGKPLEDNWNESTDPKKFIYEDIAIASYLIVLWEQERVKNGIEDKQSFVDLGCGNGLLVYILTGEGHRGYGIDLRRRKIWDILNCDLRESAIVPSDDHLFPEVDWILGNHSDELSPWIPVISARSSLKSNYFLLPCCAYEFSGVKYNKKGSKSQYLEFVDFLLEISNVCGFAETQIDRMKIPSTKRICLIGTGRLYDENAYEDEKLKIQNFIDSRNGQCGNTDKWSESFKPREKVEQVRNCIRLDKSLKDSISKRIFDHLLEKSENFNENYGNWNIGGVLTIAEAVQMLTSDELKQLKSEFGGLQTLLKNKHQAFYVHDGKVEIRIPTKMSEFINSKKKYKIRTSECYFYHNHVQGCPLNESECPYLHTG